jgi:ribosomal protein L30/L7E
MTPTLRALVVLTGSLCAVPALAQTDTPLARLVERGQTVEVRDDDGREVRGRIRAVSAATMTLEGADDVFEIPVAKITRIARPADSLADGALIGFSAGAVFGLLGSTVGTSDCDAYYYGPCPEGAGFVVGSTLVFGAIGAGIGVGVDALIHRGRVIYRRDAGRQTRVTPVVGKGVAGAMASISW